MLSNVKIGHRIAVSFALMLVITVAVLVPVFLSRFESVIEQAERRELRGLFDNINAAIEAEGRKAESMAALVAGMPQVQRAMAEDNRDQLQELFVAGFETLRAQYGVRQFQFHKAPAISYFRVHKPAKFGDDLSSFRKTVVATNTNRTVVHGVERGVAGLGVRGITPIFHNGKHVGSVEFGLSFGQPFFDAFKEQYGVDVALFLKQEDGSFKPFASTLKDAQLLGIEQMNQALSGQQLVEQTKSGDTPLAVFAGAVKDYSGQPLGVLEVAMDRSYYAEALTGTRNTALLVAAIALVVGVLLAALVARGIVRPIRAAVDAMRDIAAGEGDLTRRLQAEGRNEVAELAHAFNRFADKVRNVVADVAGSTAQVAAAAEEMSAITDESNRGVSRQRSEIEQVATAMNEMTATVQEVARNASQAARSAEAADQEAVQGQGVVREAVKAIEAVAGEVERAAAVIQRLEADSESISAVLDVIRGVAEQTNLLALNAAIEAARAGEQGRGFAVVADEVRTLASRTQESTGEIQEVIERLQAGARDAASVMQQGQVRAKDSVARAQEAGVSLSKITKSVATISDMNAQIASAAEEQSAVSDEINKNVANINEVADSVTESAGQTAEASNQLARLAADLQALVGQFKYG